MCAPEFSDLEVSIWQAYKHESVRVLGISSQPESVINRFIIDQGITFPVLRDNKGVYSDYNFGAAISPYPRDFVVDQNGIIRFASTEYDPGRIMGTIESLISGQSVGSVDPQMAMPQKFVISQVYPNPFNSIAAVLVENDLGRVVDLEVFDVSGRWVDTIYSGWLTGGHHRFNWNAKSDALNPVASGVYIILLRSEHNLVTRKTVFLR